jgi:hypothetical protein
MWIQFLRAIFHRETRMTSLVRFFRSRRCNDALLHGGGGGEDSSIPRENAEELGPYFDYHPGKVCRKRIWNDC